MARGVLADLPDPFRASCAEIVLRTEDFATAEQLAGVGMLDRWELTGLYEGIPLPQRTSGDSGDTPPHIWLFRMPILAEMRATRVPIEELVRHVVIHEAGHHFGLSDADMHALEATGED